MNQKKIGNFLKELRKEKGVTQEQLAEVLGVSNRSISRWENGVNMPDFDLLIEVAKYYEVEIEEILNGERKTENMDKKTEETLYQIADYTNHEKRNFARRMHWMFGVAIAGNIICLIIESLGLSDVRIYRMIESFALGLGLGMLIVAFFMTGKYALRIKAAKQRLLKRKAVD
ncbi:MAG: helix-turn-helix transcriptional regulator [Lachnospiraceae bacterium]|nr:helix-turn-helix transcriptional regulator [Lachnospiraceae bacterium]